MALKQAILPQTIIYLLRNDLRLHDNECFNYIACLAEKLKTKLSGTDNTPLHLVPLYCFQPEHYISGTYNFGFARVGEPRARFTLEAVKDLKLHLQSKGSDLIIKSCFANEESGSPVNAVSSVIEQLGITKGRQEDSQDSCSNCTLIFHEEATQEELDVESSLIQLCDEYGVQVKSFWGSTLHHKDDIPFKKVLRKGSDAPDVPDVYTQFRMAVEAKSKVRSPFPTPASLPPLPNHVLSDDMPTEAQVGVSHELNMPLDKSAFPFKGGETAALKRLNDYLWGNNAITTYKETRNGLVGTEYSTKFSPWLAIGNLSPRAIYAEVRKYEASRTKNQSTYWVIFELLWRDYFRFVCLKYGTKVFFPGGIRGMKVNWKQDKNMFDRWKSGTTGVPFVDANMREILRTGWMSNRGRQNVASFLVKDMKLDWRLGAEWFESMLIDHDVCSNYGNWNYAAGIGNDPREDRKFNVIKQGLDYDLNGEFVKLWVPELANLAQSTSSTKGKIHFPWKLSPGELNSAGIQLGVTYPKPMLVAGEWERHYGKVMKKTGGPSDSRPASSDSRHQGPQKQRGMDFYFSSSSNPTSRR